MDASDKDKLRARLFRGGSKERSYAEKKRLREQSKLRRANKDADSGRENWDGSDDVERESMARRASDVSAARDEIDDTANEPIATSRALIVSLAPSRARIRIGDEEHDAALTNELAAEQQTAIAVGDDVQVERVDDLLVVSSVEPRRSHLSRPDPANPHRERVIAANVDLALVVVSVAAPALKPALIDRMLIAIEHGGVGPAIVVNKADLIADDEARRAVEDALAPHRALGIRCQLVSAANGEGVRELRTLVDGRRCVFVGHSGVGKSSLLNALAPELALRTGDVREFDGKGRHTTTQSSLVRLWGSTELIDTPGVRSFGLWNIDADTLRAHFVEFEPFSRRCRFADCSHLVEPGCGVRAAIEARDLDAARFAIYARMRQSL